MWNDEINPKPLDIVNEIEHSKDESKHHLSLYCKRYKFNTEINMFQKSLFIPDYINDEKFHIVTKDDIHRLDLISWKYYSTPELWWVIAEVNNINPFELEEGQVLRILPSQYLLLNLLRYTTTS
jgi:nucleoid-associated protein YgaU